MAGPTATRVAQQYLGCVGVRAADTPPAGDGKRTPHYFAPDTQFVCYKRLVVKNSRCYQPADISHPLQGLNIIDLDVSKAFVVVFEFLLYHFALQLHGYAGIPDSLRNIDFTFATAPRKTFLFAFAAWHPFNALV